MINAQKIIKYAAIGFAVFLIVGIVSSIMFGITAITSIFSDKEIKETTEVINVNGNISSLEIDVSSLNLEIKEDSSFKIETNDKYIKIREHNNKLTITERKHNLFSKGENNDLIIYIPSNFIFNDIEIDSGAGRIDIDKLTTRRLDLDLGAGEVSINNLNVLNEAEINGGAGEININNSSLTNLDLDMGVGKLTLNSSLLGNSQIDAGVGEMDINLIDNDYRIMPNKGIGKITINNEEIKTGTYYGSGLNYIEVNGGIGNIKINY